MTKTKSKHKKAKDLTKGDKVIDLAGKVVTVSDINHSARGFFHNSVIIPFKEGGWACVMREADIELAK